MFLPVRSRIGGSGHHGIFVHMDKEYDTDTYILEDEFWGRNRTNLELESPYDFERRETGKYMRTRTGTRELEPASRPLSFPGQRHYCS